MGGRVPAGSEKLCAELQEEGVHGRFHQKSPSGTKSILARSRKTLPSPAVSNNFMPLNVVITEDGVGFSDFAKMLKRGPPFNDVALFLALGGGAGVYLCCHRSITSEVQQQSPGNLCRFRKRISACCAAHNTKTLLSTWCRDYCPGKNHAQEGEMRANVMQRFIQQAAERALARRVRGSSVPEFICPKSKRLTHVSPGWGDVGHPVTLTEHSFRESGSIRLGPRRGPSLRGGCGRWRRR